MLPGLEADSLGDADDQDERVVKELFRLSRQPAVVAVVAVAGCRFWNV